MFEIEKNVPVPQGRVELPDYGIPFKKMKKGDSLFLPSDAVPVEHARTLIGRFSRIEKVKMITRTEKNDAGEVVGLRVWRGEPLPVEQETVQS